MASCSWNIWYQPLAALIFYISSLAESNRLPFDLSECEQELVGGYHTEYGGLRMVLFFVGEYTHLGNDQLSDGDLVFRRLEFPVDRHAGERITSGRGS